MILILFRFNDIDKATNSKSSLEHCQREEARLRKEANEEWETKLFSLVGDNWIYDNPLVKRLITNNEASPAPSLLNE